MKINKNSLHSQPLSTPGGDGAVLKSLAETRKLVGGDGDIASLLPGDNGYESTLDFRHRVEAYGLSLREGTDRLVVDGSQEASQPQIKGDWGRSHGVVGEAVDDNKNLADAVKAWIDSLRSAGQEGGRLSPIQALKRKVNDGEVSFEDDAKAVRLVGMSKIRALLNPGHSWFADRQGDIVEWRSYQCREASKPIFAYPSLSLVTDKLNPYKLSVKASHSAMKSLRGLGDVLSVNDIRGVKVLDLAFTFPGEITDWLVKQNHGFTRDSVDEVWKLWRKLWSKAAFKGRGKNRVKILPSLEELLLGGETGKLGCHVNLHIWSTKEPGRAHWHFHVLTMNQSYTDGRFTRIGHYLEGERLEDLKRLWKARLLQFADEHGIKVPSLKGKALPVVYFQYIDGSARAKIVHKWQYVNRSSIEDFALYSNDNPGCDNPPDWLVEYDNRARAFGWFREITGILGKEVREALNEDRLVKTCPVCGDRMEALGTLTNADIAARAENGTLYSLEWVDGKLCSVLVTEKDISFLSTAYW